MITKEERLARNLVSYYRFKAYLYENAKTGAISHAANYDFQCKRQFVKVIDPVAKAFRLFETWESMLGIDDYNNVRYPSWSILGARSLNEAIAYFNFYRPKNNQLSILKYSSLDELDLLLTLAGKNVQ